MILEKQILILNLYVGPQNPDKEQLIGELLAIVQYPGKHSKILATIFLLLPTVLNSRVSQYSGRSHYFFPSH